MQLMHFHPLASCTRPWHQIFYWLQRFGDWEIDSQFLSIAKSCLSLITDGNWIDNWYKKNIYYIYIYIGLSIHQFTAFTLVYPIRPAIEPCSLNVSCKVFMKLSCTVSTIFRWYKWHTLNPFGIPQQQSQVFSLLRAASLPQPSPGHKSSRSCHLCSVSTNRRAVWTGWPILLSTWCGRWQVWAGP